MRDPLSGGTLAGKPREPPRRSDATAYRRAPTPGFDGAPGGFLAQQASQALGARAARRLGGTPQQILRVARRQRPAEEEALRLVAGMLLQEQQLRQTLDAFGGHADAQRARHRNDRGGDRPIVAALIQARHEGL